MSIEQARSELANISAELAQQYPSSNKETSATVVPFLERAIDPQIRTDEQRDAARQALRGFLDKIVIPSGEGLLQVVGNFGEMLAAASGRGRPGAEAVGYVGCGGSQPAVLAVVERSGVSPKIRKSAGAMPRTVAA